MKLRRYAPCPSVHAHFPYIPQIPKSMTPAEVSFYYPETDYRQKQRKPYVRYIEPDEDESEC